MPYPGFFHKMMNCDRFVYVDNVEFVGRGPFGWIHRNKIRLHNKDEHWLTVPVYQKDRYHQNINEVEIANEESWQDKHWKSIYYNYKDAPYFEEYEDELRSIYEDTWQKLVNLNIRLLEFFADALSIDAPRSVSSEDDISGESTQLIINLCGHYDGDDYLSGQHGRDYLDRELVKDSDIEVLFQNFECPEYPQQYDGFVPNLSTLDMLMNCGPKTRELIEEGGSISKDWE